MKIIKISLKKLIKKTKESEDLFNEVLKILKSGKIIVYPTDTSYGLGGDFFNKKSHKRIYEIKNRPKQKLFSVIVDSIKTIKKIARVNKKQEKILKKYLPGRFTFILESKNKKFGKTIGVRIPNFKFTKILSKKFKNPIIATSLNISRRPQCYSIDNFLKQIKNSKVKPDLILNVGKLPKILPSTVVDLTSNKIKIVRQGSGNLILKN